MRIELFGHDLATLQRWEKALALYRPEIVGALAPSNGEKIVVADFSTASRDILAYLKNRHEDDGIRLIVLEGAPDTARAKKLLAAGVRGYGNAYMQPVHLHSCVETAAAGKIWVYPDFVYAMMQELASGDEEGMKEELPDTLTPREKELAARILEGLSNRQIAETLGITERTVKAHLSKIYEKLHVANRLELALKLKEGVA